MEEIGGLLGIIIAVVSLVLPFICSGLVFIGMGVAIWLGWRYLQRAKARAATEQRLSLAWPSVEGLVIQSRVEVSGGEYTSVAARIRYEYQVDGKTYQNEQVRVGENTITQIGSRQNPYDIVERYPVSAVVQVYYNPANPGESALER